jgi:alcohol dehydrogenase (cytochrome c)
VQANRNGFFYVLDRTTGEFLSGTGFAKNITWASGLDAKGRPVRVSGMEPSRTGSVCARRSTARPTGTRRLLTR